MNSLAALDLNLLVILRALLTERQVTRAAKQVGLSQSATSHALARLRQQLGDPLLVRSGQGLVLTPRATRILPQLERGLGELQAAISDDPIFEPSTARRSFTLSMGDYAQAVLLGPLLRRLSREAPAVELMVVGSTTPDEALEAGSADMALTVLKGAVPPPRPLGPALRSAPLFSDEFMCMVRRRHPSLRSRLTLTSYANVGHVLVAPTGTPGSIVDVELAKLGRERRIAVRISSFLAAPIVVAESDFINTGPARLARRAAQHHAVRLLPPPLALPSFELHLLWHARLEQDPAQIWLRGVLGEVSANLA